MTESEAQMIEPRDSAVRTLVEVSLRELVNQANAETYSVIESHIPNAEPPPEGE